MRALVLAAGKGTRLSHISPKPLTPFLGLTLIERTILSAKEAGITEIVIVVGYKGEDVKKVLDSGECLGVKLRYIENPDWERENGLSALKAKEVLDKENFILLMSDHVFDPKILSEILRKGREKCVLAVDTNIEKIFDREDATKVLIENGVPKAIGKELADYNAVDCGIFYCTPELFKALEKTTGEGRYTLIDACQYLIEEERLEVMEVESKFWYDIDTQESLKHAEKRMLESLTKETDGIISRHINRKISSKISKVLVRTRITPNQMSVVAFALALVSAVLFLQGEFLYLIVAGLIVQLSSILDGCDGEIARLKFQQSSYGAWFDAVLDRYADALIIIGMVYGYWRVYADYTIWIVGFVALIGSFMISYTADKHDTVFRVKGNRGIMIRRDMRLFLIMLGALLNQVFYILIILAILTNIEAIRRLISLRNR